MTVKNINIDELKDYVYNAFIDDEELIEYFDKNANVKTTNEAIESVCEKIKSQYSDSAFFGVEINGIKEGYFVFRENLLISFGMNKKYRNKEVLSEFWEEIKKHLGNSFQAALYSYNTRAISFLEKCGMKILYDNITILSNDLK